MLAIKQDIARFNISMDQPLFVCRCQAREDLFDNLKAIIKVQATLPFQEFGQRFAFDVLHRKEMEAVGFSDEENLDDIGMNQLGRRRGFRPKPPYEVWLTCKFRRQDFDGHFSIERSFVPQIHVAHSTLSDTRQNFKVPERVKRYRFYRRSFVHRGVG